MTHRGPRDVARSRPDDDDADPVVTPGGWTTNGKKQEFSLADVEAWLLEQHGRQKVIRGTNSMQAPCVHPDHEDEHPSMSVSERDGHVLVRCHERAVPMIPPVAETLAQLSQRDRWMAEDDLVFAHPHTGTFLSAFTVIPYFKDALSSAGVREVRFHDLRHTFGTQMAAGGVPSRTLQAWMGHASITTTEIYAAYAPDPTGGRDLAHRAFQTVSARDNCYLTAEVPNKPASLSQVA